MTINPQSVAQKKFAISQTQRIKEKKMIHLKGNTPKIYKEKLTQNTHVTSKNLAEKNIGNYKN